MVNVLAKKKRWANALAAISKPLAVIAGDKLGGSEAAKEIVKTVFEQGVSTRVVIAPEPVISTPGMVIRVKRAAKHPDEWCTWISRTDRF